MANVMYTNAVYFPNYRIYQGDTPGMLNYSCINHVYYAYASVAQDGGVFVSSGFLDTALTWRRPCWATGHSCYVYTGTDSSDFCSLAMSGQMRGLRWMGSKEAWVR